MGTGASVESARSTMTSVLAGKPLDASDIDVLKYSSFKIIIFIELIFYFVS